MRAKVLAHRGLWSDSRVQNSIEALTAACSHGFGVEFDVRDDRGSLVVSHDPPQGGEPYFAEAITAIVSVARDLPVAINVKADGLAPAVAEEVAKHPLGAAFVFDMAVPDAVLYLQEGVDCFTRVSEYESSPSFYQQSAGVWVDEFNSTWCTESQLAGYLSDGKAACLVSPELHGRDPDSTWKMWRGWSLPDSGSLMVCTDLPDQAREFFDD